MSYTLFSMTERKARKPHRCIWCGQAIAAGEAYKEERSLFDGDFQHFHWHPECKDAAHKYHRESGEEEFDAWDNERPIPPNT